MPHEVPGVFSKLPHHCQGFSQEDMEQATEAVSRVPLGRTWFRPEGYCHVPLRNCIAENLSQTGEG